MHQWFKSYGKFAEWVDFAHWLSFSGKGLRLHLAQQACFNTICIKSFFILGRFVCLLIRTILFMFGFGFEFSYGPLSLNFWIVSYSVWKDLALLEFVWTSEVSNMGLMHCTELHDNAFHCMHCNAQHLNYMPIYQKR